MVVPDGGVKGVGDDVTESRSTDATSVSAPDLRSAEFSSKHSSFG